MLSVFGYMGDKKSKQNNKQNFKKIIFFQYINTKEYSLPCE